MGKNLRWYHWLFFLWVLSVSALFVSNLLKEPVPLRASDIPREVFCAQLLRGGYGVFETEVDTGNISIDGDLELVTDTGTGFTGGVYELLEVCRKCETEVLPSSGSRTIVSLCDVVFVVSDNHKIVEIWTLDDYQHGGE